MKRVVSLLFAVILVFGLAATVYAAGSVTYDANAQKFIFAPGTSHSPTNLFENFQNVMPGDTVTDQILIRNDAANNVKIKVYLRSLGAQDNTDDFLSQLKLTVEQGNDSLLYAAPANETAQLADWVYLGTVYSGGEITLDITLEVPITMGNEYQSKVGYIDWEFKIEELPIEDTDPKPPYTGDNTNLLLYGSLMALSLIAFFLLLKSRKRST